jgi:hypothetical protein
MSLIKVGIDATQLEQWAAELSARGLRNAIRRAVDQSARAARKITIGTIERDIGVSKSKFKDAVPKVRASTAGDLAARWTIGKARIGILNVAGAKVSKTIGLRASTHRLTGGGSASLNVKNAFVVNSKSGGRFVAFRRGSDRLPIKGVYAEHPATAMGQANAAARQTWEREASREAAMRLPVEVAKQFAREGLGPASPVGSED